MATGAPPPDGKTPLERSASAAALKGTIALLGPAFVAAVAYIDPGNFATNIAGGAKYGYMLVWVIVAANLMAMLVQYLSRQDRHRDRPQPARSSAASTSSKPVTFGLWVQAEAIAIATDLAEFVGAAIALNLLFGVPPFIAGLMTAVVAFAILELQTRGHRRFELAIAGFLGDRLHRLHVRPAAGRRRPGRVRAGPDPALRRHRQRAAGRRHPRRDRDAARRLPALGADQRTARGATSTAEKRELLRFQRLDVVLAMGLAGFINLTMLVVAAQLFHDAGRTNSTIEGAHAGFNTLLGGGAGAGLRGRAARVRAVQLERRHVRRPGRDAGLHQPPDPALPRRAITMAPSLIVLAIGVDPSTRS